MPDPRPRLSMRELRGPLAIFLGALALAVAVALGPLVGGTFRAIPLDTDQTWVADGSDGTRLLDRCSLEAPHARVVTGSVQQQRRIQTVQPSDGDVVTLQAGTALGVSSYLIDGLAVSPERACAEPTIAATVDRVTLDRRTAAPVGESQIQYDDEQAPVIVVDRRGYTYVLPYAFDPAGAQYFDALTRQSVPMHVVGTETMGGRDVTRFRVDVPLTDLATGQDPRAVITKPAAWFGSFDGVADDELLTATLQHRAVRDLFVDTRTGVIVAERSEIDEAYRFTPDVRARNTDLDAYALPNVVTTLNSDQQTIRDAAAVAAARERAVMITTRVIPLVAGIVGVIGLVAGVWLLRPKPGLAKVHPGRRR